MTAMRAHPAQCPATVLVVDDEPINVELLVSTLEPEGYRLVATTDSRSAVELARRESPDLILLDVIMPGLNGFDVCEQLKSDADLRDIPIVIVTALSEVDDYVHAIDSGADDFMTKPFNSTVLRARVRGYLRSRRLTEEVKRLHELKGDLTRMIVHDLNGPMQGISGYLDLAFHQGDLSQRTRGFLERAQRSCSEASRMIQNLLSIESLEAGVLEPLRRPTSLSDLIERCAEPLRPAWESRGHTVVFEGPEDIEAEIDADLVGRVVQNLLNNAIKFATRDGPIEVGWNDSDEQWRVWVANRGPAVSEADQARMFEKFAQVGRRPELARQGCGLGLAFCRLAAEAHGGSVAVESPLPGLLGGARFTVVLPRGLTNEPVEIGARHGASESQNP